MARDKRGSRERDRLLQPVAWPCAAGTPDGFDKVEHFTAYCGLAVWFTGLYPRTRYWLVVSGLLALGLAVEIAQGVMQLGRSAEFFDMVANAVGVGVGLLLALALTGGWARRVESWLSRR